MDDPFFVVVGIILSLLALITLIVASAIIMIVLFFWKTKCRSIANLLVCNSSAALVFYVIAISLQIPSLFQTRKMPSEGIFCELKGFLYCFASSVKSLSYLVQAISRCLIIVRYKHVLLRRFRVYILLLLSSWALSLIICGSILFFPSAYRYEPESRLCVLTSKAFLTSFIPVVLLFFVPLVMIFLLYGLIIWQTTFLQRTRPNGLRKMAMQRNLHVYRNILFLVAIMVIGGMPYVLAVIINRFNTIPSWLYSVSICFISFAATTESLVIFFTHRQIREWYEQKRHFFQANRVAIIR